MKLSVSGLRGLVGKDLTPKIIARYSLAFASLFDGKPLAIARDTRESGPAIARIVEAAFMWSGSETHNFGVVPTPAFLRLLNLTRMAGGIMVSASHNPPRWNALKFAFGDRLSREEEVALIVKKLDSPPASNRFGKYYDSSARVFQLYLETLDGLAYDLRGLRVVVDSQNGATGTWVPKLLRSLGADVFAIRTEEGPLPEDPEPKRERFVEMDILLKKGLYDVGFGYDPDGDRVIVGLKGTGMLSEEHTTALALYSAATYLPVGDRAILNFSTSTLSEKILKGMGISVERYKVGEANVIKRMEERRSILGGEGNGGLIYTPFSKGRDGVLAAILLSKLVLEGKVPKEVVFADVRIGKEKLRMSMEEVLRAFEKVVSGFDLDRTDGYYFRDGDNWIHIRPSNTEPVVRVIWEGNKSFYREINGILAKLKDYDHA
ncbi:MAG: hypothetical protein GXO39_02820 [Thermotogae bacterium]|nr:hypothetical protein [Thermotogota bacterium]